MPYQDWTRSEVEATVADYFDMLQQELSGLEYNKAEHRRRLRALLGNRSDGAIERKHQNISAILIELGFVYISGYKPLSNYQQLLFDVVSNRLAASADLHEAVRMQVTAPAPVPTVESILSALVDPPKPDPNVQAQGAGLVRERTARRALVDYLATEARNRSLGAAGEEFALRYEVARLSYLGKERLAGKVERVSETRGDGEGFDILSFEASGAERWIEVKTTAYGASTPFFVSKNEVAVSREAAQRYYVYRAFDFRRGARMFAKQGPIPASFALEPSQYIARMG